MELLLLGFITTLLALDSKPKAKEPDEDTPPQPWPIPVILNQQQQNASGDSTDGGSNDYCT